MICFLQVLLHTPKNGDEDVLHASFSSFRLLRLAIIIFEFWWHLSVLRFL